MTRERLTGDAEEMVEWIRKELGVRKIFIWGHSWGSYLGLQIALRHPQWLFAYIGTGQITNSPESERRAWAYALEAAKHGDVANAVTELQAVAPYAVPGKPIELKDAMIVHKWGDYFGGVMAYRTSQEDESHAGRLSPDYSDAEAPHIYDGNEFSERFLLAGVFNLDLSHQTNFKCPIILLLGRHDRTVNSELAREWLERVNAPQKHLVWFENSAHEPESEEPGKFLLSLIRYARPLAEK